MSESQVELDSQHAADEIELHVVLCIDSRETSQGLAVCGRTPHQAGYHQARIFNPDTGEWMARWFGTYVELIPIGGSRS